MCGIFGCICRKGSKGCVGLKKLKVRTYVSNIANNASFPLSTLLYTSLHCVVGEGKHTSIIHVVDNVYPLTM
jgi:hypothetical protein